MPEQNCTLCDASNRIGVQTSKDKISGLNQAGLAQEMGFERSILLEMAAKREVEIKFKIDSVQAVVQRLESLGFSRATERTHEMNTLYDLPGGRLRRRGALLRVRQYGPKWTVTYKDRNAVGRARHKSRREVETEVRDGQALAAILENVGFGPSFAYEKYRSEWTDGVGHVVLDETPIGDFGEIEGPPRWIDQVADRLGIPKHQYITSSYSELFLAWKRQTRKHARHMLFSEVQKPAKVRFHR